MKIAMRTMTPKRVIVCGCRDWDDLEQVELEIETLDIEVPDPITIVHGASGKVDLTAEEYAIANCEHQGWSVERHPADWKKHGKGAGPIRNREMAKAGAWLCLAFWDGKSPGTANMISEATKYGIPVKIVPRKKPEQVSLALDRDKREQLCDELDSELEKLKGHSS